MIWMGGLLVVVSAILDMVFRRMLAARQLYLHRLFSNARTTVDTNPACGQRIVNNDSSGTNPRFDKP